MNARETPRLECLRRIAETGADWEEIGNGQGLDAIAWSPAGLVWNATSCHSLSVCFYTDRPSAWRSLREDLRAGVSPCEEPSCETCHDEAAR